MATYIYSVSLDFPGGLIDIANFRSEITRSPIKTALDEILRDGDAVSVVFKDTLSAGDKTRLDGDEVGHPKGGLIAAHDSALSLGNNAVRIQNPDETIVNWPMTSGGGSERTPLFNPNVIAPGYLLYVTGAYDDINNVKRGEGALMTLQVTDEGTSYIDGQFLEHVYVIGGDVGVINEGVGDWCSMLVWAPASAPEDRTSTHDGNANKVSAGAYNIIVPAPGNDGDWNVDGSTLTAGEINTGLSPIPDRDGSGYWNWDPDADPSITPVSNPATPDGSYHLIDADAALVRQANRVALLCHEVPCCPDAIKGKKLLPHWKIRLYVHRASAGTVSAAFVIKTTRKSTVNSTDLA